MSDPGVLRFLPRDLRDTDVVRVRVVGPNAVWVLHRDRTYATHIFEPEELYGIAEPLRDPEVFATATVIDDMLGWDLPGGVYDLASDALWLHAHGRCDGSHDLSAVVRGTSLTDGVIGLEFGEQTAEEATARRLHASELLGLNLRVSEYERSLYAAEGRVPPPDPWPPEPRVLTEETP